MKRKRHKNQKSLDLSKPKPVDPGRAKANQEEDHQAVEAWLSRKKRPKTEAVFATGFESMSSKGFGWMGNRFLRPI